MGDNKGAWRVWHRGYSRVETRQLVLAHTHGEPERAVLARQHGAPNCKWQNNKKPKIQAQQFGSEGWTPSSEF